MTEKIIVTKKGKEDLEKKLKVLIDEKRPEVIEEIKLARSQGDLSENADYDAARAKQGVIEAQIKQIEAMLESCDIIEEDKKSRGVKAGSKVKLKDYSDNEIYQYTIVGSIESDPTQGKISNNCQLALAILGKGKGAKVTVLTDTPYEVEILEIE